jgi:hypothetical protein
MMRKVIGTASGRGSRSFRIAEFEADGVGWESGSLWTRCWRELDSNPRSPVAGRGQAARNQILRRGPSLPLSPLFDLGESSPCHPDQRG